MQKKRKVCNKFEKTVILCINLCREITTIECIKTNKMAKFSKNPGRRQAGSYLTIWPKQVTVMRKSQVSPSRKAQECKNSDISWYRFPMELEIRDWITVPHPPVLVKINQTTFCFLVPENILEISLCFPHLLIKQFASAWNSFWIAGAWK